MINLIDLQPTRITRDLKGKYIMIYGDPKVGKTTFASKFEKALLLAFEPGYNGLDNLMVQPILKWGDFKTVIRQLGQSEVKEKFSTIIIDTADIAWSYCEKYVLAQNPNSMGEIPTSLGDISWGKGFTLCKKEYDEALRKIATMGYGLVIISHSKAKTIKDNNGEEYERIVPTLPDMAKLIVNRLVDVIAYLRADDEGNRYLYTRGNKNFEAGSRFQYLNPKIPLGYNNLVEELCKAIDEEAQHNGNTAAASGINAFYDKTNERKFEDVIEEAKSVFEKLVSANKDNAVTMNNIILKVFGKQIKLSETTQEQQELVETVLNEWKSLLKE